MTITIRPNVLLTIGLLALYSLDTVEAQPVAPWQEFPIDAGFDHWADTLYPAGAMFFADSLTGYCAWQKPWIPPDPPTTGFAARTTDGGMTWSVNTASVPRPHLLRGRFGVSPSGRVSTDGGLTWSAVGSGVIQMVNSTLTDSALPRYMATVTARPRRLSFSTDAGRTWTPADSLVTRICSRHINDSTIVWDTLQGLLSRTVFGQGPGDPAGLFAWRHLAGLSDSILYAISTTAASACDSAAPGGAGQQMWRIDLVRRTCSVWPIAASVLDRLENLTVFDSASMVCYKSGNNEHVLRTLDGGRRWDTLARFNTWNLRFFSAAYAIGNLFVTIDSGRTWRRWRHPFGGNAYFWALDSLHMYVIGTSGNDRLCLRTYDAGRTWLRNNPTPTRVSAMLARGGVVQIAADPTTFLRSTDSGRTWIDIRDAKDAFPPDVSVISAMAYPDTIMSPERVLAAASRVTFDSVAYGLIESTDNGLTWRWTGTMLPDKVTSVGFRANVDPPFGWLTCGGAFYFTSDGGATWSNRGQLPPGAVMGDALHGIAAQVSDSGDGVLSRTTDGGLTWQQTATLPPPNNDPMGQVAFDALRYSLLVPDIYQGYSRQLSMHTTDGGATWKTMQPRSAITLAAPILWLSPSRAYCLRSGAIIYSADSGRRFEQLHEPWGSSGRAWDDDFIYIVNWEKQKLGRWPIRESGTSVPVAHAGEQLEVCVLGNPVTGSRAVLQVLSQRLLRASVRIVDALGRVRSIAEHELGAGSRTTIALDTTNLESGSYDIVVQAGGIEKRTRAVVVR